MKRLPTLAIGLLTIFLTGCLVRTDQPGLVTSAPASPAAAVTPTPTPLPKDEIKIIARPVKIAQLVGEYDKESNAPTINQTLSRYKLTGTDLGVPFQHKGKTYIVFGDTLGSRKGDAIAYTTDTNPDDGLSLEFISDSSGTYKPILIPGVSQGAFEVPVAGVSTGGRMYIYHTTGSKGPATEGGRATMGRSIVAVSDDDGKTFSYLYDLSSRHFINVSIEEADESSLGAVFGQEQGKILIIFGSGPFLSLIHI